MVRTLCLHIQRIILNHSPGEEDPCEWPNTNAFYANIEECRIFYPSPTFAIWVMRDAFEQILEKEEGYFPGMRQQYILAAAQWILWSGQSIFKQIIYPDDEHPEGRASWSPGPLYDGEPLLNLRRWRFWRDGFEKAAGDNCLNEECRGVSRKVAAIMVLWRMACCLMLVLNFFYMERIVSCIIPRMNL